MNKSAWFKSIVDEERIKLGLPKYHYENSAKIYNMDISTWDNVDFVYHLLRYCLLIPFSLQELHRSYNKHCKLRLTLNPILHEDNPDIFDLDYKFAKSYSSHRGNNIKRFTEYFEQNFSDKRIMINMDTFCQMNDPSSEHMSCIKEILNDYGITDMDIENDKETFNVMLYNLEYNKISNLK